MPIAMMALMRYLVARASFSSFRPSAVLSIPAKRILFIMLVPLAEYAGWPVGLLSLNAALRSPPSLTCNGVNVK